MKKLWLVAAGYEADVMAAFTTKEAAEGYAAAHPARLVAPEYRHPNGRDVIRPEIRTSAYYVLSETIPLDPED